jgi:predicted ferric reductase
MPALRDELARRAGLVMEELGNAVLLAEREASEIANGLAKRINIPSNSSSPPGLIEANTRDPFSKSGKYALGVVYFCIILLVFTSLRHYYHLFGDRIRAALYEEEVAKSSKTSSPDTDYELSVLGTDRSTRKFFPRTGPLPAHTPKSESSVSSIKPLNNFITLFRWVFYRPLPIITLRRGWRPITFPSLGVTLIVFAAVAFTTCYTFIPQPLYWQSIQYGAPPVAVRSGMLAVALMPWIVALSMKANIISIMTGIGHERLNVLHRWAAYLCLFLSLIHTIPFYITPIWDQGGLAVYKSFFNNPNFYVYGTGMCSSSCIHPLLLLTLLGIAALVPLGFLCIHSLPQIRNHAYEVFVTLHVPVSMILLGMLFWHCHNYLTSWNYLFATLGIWLFSYIMRLAYLNWTNPFRMSWLIGDEAAVTILPENAIKVTIPTQMKWRPGQYVYLRMPGISVFENHPFTIASLCSEDFPSEYGEGYRDMVLVFRPFAGFTQKVLRNAVEHGPWHTYRAFIDGPYGGMNRRLESFDHVILIAGGSGITAVASQLLDLIKRMRDGKAITKKVEVIWALKRPETMEWFKEELRICREFAPPETVTCQFYITTAKRHKTGEIVSARTPNRPVSIYFHDKVNDAFQGIADKRASGMSSKRNSAFIREEAAGDEEREKELRRENEDAITALPQAHLKSVSQGGYLAPPGVDSKGRANELAAPTPIRSMAEKRRSRNLSIDIQSAVNAGSDVLDPGAVENPQAFDFGFPSTPTEFQKNLMRFAFLPAAVKKKDGWSTEYGRPDIPYMLREMSRDFGKRTCVYVCGPPSMRLDVQKTVAGLQSKILRDSDKDELFLHAENYAI